MTDEQFNFLLDKIDILNENIERLIPIQKRKGFREWEEIPIEERKEVFESYFKD